MNLRMIAAALVLLISGQAFAYDASRASRYALPDLFRPNVDRIIINGPGSTGPADPMTVAPGPGAVTRSLADKLSERPSWLDYASVFDLGDCAPAIERAVAKGIKAMFFSSRVPCYIKRTVNLPNAGVSFVGDGRKTAEIRLLGKSDVFFNVGNATTVSYNFFVDNILFTKEQQSTSGGAVLKLTNVYKWGIGHSRIYGDHKIWRVIDITSSSNAVNYDVDVENVRDRVVSASCGTAPPGNPGGQCYDMKFDHWYVYGSNEVATDVDSGGAFVFLDNFQAITLENTMVGKHRGYAYDLRGTLANRANNALNFIINPNVEADYVSTGVARFVAVRASQIGGSASWVSSWGGTNGADFPGISIGKDSQNNVVRGLQLNVDKAGGIGLQDDGKFNRIQDIDFSGIDPAAVNTALVIGPNAQGGTYTCLSAAQFPRVIYDNSPATAGHVIRDIEYSNISGQPLSGLAGSPSSNKVVRGITNLDAGAPSVVAASVLNLPDKGETFTVNTAGTINGIKPTYIRRRVTLLFAQPGTQLGYMQVAPGEGAFYLTGNGPVTFSGAPSAITFEWEGDYWWEISRSR